MILHVASIAAFFVTQVAQAPVVVQCVVPPSPDPWWKQWIPTAISLLSVGVGLWIAIRTIHNARELTEWSFRATSEKDHERWVLDQKKAEWKELLIKVAAIEEIIPCIQKRLPYNPKVEDAVLAILPLSRGSIFIYQVIESSGFIESWTSFAIYVSSKFESDIKADDEVQKMSSVLLNSGDKEGARQLREKAEFEIRQRLHSLREELRTLAHKDLGI